MENGSERVLNAWLKLSMAISNERMVSDMPYNETLIYGILYRANQADPQKKLTATDLCNETHMLKSLMNRTLNSMEQQELIFRERSQSDRRQVFVCLNPQKVDIYEKQHKKVLDFVDAILDKIGRERTDEIAQMLTLISETAEEVLK